MLFNRLASCIALANGVAAMGLRDTIAEQPDLSTFKDLVDQYDVWQPLSSMDNITVLAPNNAAYELLSRIGLNLSEMGADFTVPILKYHFLEGMYDSESFTNDAHATLVHTALTGLNMSQSAPVKLSRSENDRLVEGGLQLAAGVVNADIKFDGGLVHVLNSTLVAPHNISATAFMNQLYEFLEVMESSDMVGTMEDLHDATIFLPQDAAWQKYKSLLGLMSPAQVAKVLGYHAVKGDVLYQQTLTQTEQTYTTIEGNTITVSTDGVGNVLVNGVSVIKENLVWYGGVAHIIDDVLIPGKLQRSPTVAESTDLCAAGEHDESRGRSGLVMQVSGSSTHSILLYVKKRPVATTSALSLAVFLFCLSVVAVFRRHRSRRSILSLPSVMQEQQIVREKLLP